MVKINWGNRGLPAVHSDRMVSRLLLLFLHCSNDVNHAFPVGGDAHLRPAMEMELTHRSSLVLLETQKANNHLL